MSSFPANQKQGGSYKYGCITAAFVAFTLLLISGCWRTYTRLHLEVTECESKNILLRLETWPGDGFSIWFLHSYDRAPFEEHYQVLHDGRILLTHMTFKSSLNGQGFATGTYHSRRDGSAELSGINQEIEEVVFRLGSPDLANHALIIHGSSLRLLDYTDPGALLCIRTQFE